MKVKIPMDAVDAYFTSRDMNVSTLRLLFNPTLFKKKLDNPETENDEKRHFRIGAAIDCILTNPPDVFASQYAVVRIPRPSGLMGKFIESLPLVLNADSPIEDYEYAYKESGFKLSIDKVVENLWNPAKDYRAFYEELKNTVGKEVLSIDEWEEINHAHRYLFNNPFTREYFIGNNDGIDYFYQVPIYFEYLGVRCKCLVDGIKVDHIHKTIQPFDLKTIGKPIGQFKHSFLQYGYYLQAAFYTEGLKQLMKESNWKPYFGKTATDGNFIINPLHELNSTFADYRGYKILNLEFVVTEVNPLYSSAARIYETTDEDIRVGMEGGAKNGKKYEGVNGLLEDLKWHRENNYWDMPKYLLDSRGREILNVFNNET